METIRAIRERRSIRKYQSLAVVEEVIGEILDLARHAPSSMNGQPWQFIVIRDEQTKTALAEIKNRYCPQEKRDYPADFLHQTPVIVVVCVETQKSFGRAIENGVLAAAYLMLAATSCGLGSSYLAAYRLGQPELAEEIQLLLELPEDVEPISIIPLGYPDEAARCKELRSLKELVHYDRFNNKA